ncbi:Hint domain-containing protein [Paracoccus sp. DMF-8]|uniref:Hint domain-containing protein n=1 Tax=Paracoccus sp. DMF-8 TaxID=3019445 RepID=UPI0023E8A42E|nr:Hint domain-containing protein [Paracoccus sp. DMF-8]MDF3607053.1 Hint domain-containing protein [Paracoccus sp. DMF-8]
MPDTVNGWTTDVAPHLQHRGCPRRTRSPTTRPSSPTVGFNPNIVDIDIIPCFTAGTMIRTVDGDVAVRDLRVGDPVLTKDHGPQPVRWIGRRKLGAHTLQASPHLRPVRIRAGALGAKTPTTDLLGSPQHRILVRSQIAQRMFGTMEVLSPAKQLLQMDGIDLVTDLAEVEYLHILFDRHEIIISNGAETESLYTGAEALKSVGPAARAEILALFPELADDTTVPEAARLLASGRPARKMAVRHIENSKPLVRR